MLIGGYQKVSLIDFPGVVAAVVFLRGCNFMCPYCHNPELLFADGETVSEEDFFAMLAENRHMLDGVCVSGGEPCLQSGLPEFLSKLKKLGLKVKLDTNGSVPEMLSRVLSQRLVDYVAMDIKSSWENYSRVARLVSAADKVKNSLSIIYEARVDCEFRTTIFPGVHTIQDFIAIAGYLEPKSKYFIQNIKRDKTLEPISAEQNLFADEVANELKSRFPHLIIGSR